MHLESHATPTAATPQQRYAALHRAIERGIVSDAVWRELGEVSLTLGHLDEARRCAEQIRSDTDRVLLETKARRHAASRGLADPRGGSRTQNRAAAPAKQLAPTPRSQRNQILEAAEEESGLRGHLVDALQFLFHQHMPWLCLLTMLAFPVVIGLGGFLTSGTSAFALAAISALPGICVCAVIFAMGRRILIESHDGTADVPEFPEMRQLGREAGRFLRDTAVVVGIFAAPVTAAFLLGLSWVGLLPMLAISAITAPMVFLLLALRGDKQALSPVLLLKALVRAGGSYPPIAASCWLLLLPMVAVSWYVLGQPIWLQIAAVGPTAVLPAFLSMRLLGTWLDANHDRMCDLFALPPRESAAAASQTVRVGRQFAGRQPAKAPTKRAQPSTKPTPGQRSQRTASKQDRPATTQTGRRPAPQRRPVAARPTTQRQPERQTQRQPQRQPAPQRAQRPAQRRAAAQQPASGQQPQTRQPQQRQPGKRKPARVAGRAPAPTNGQPRQPGQRTRPAPSATEPAADPIAASHARARQAIDARRAEPQLSSDAPDLSGLPGAVTVSGSARRQSGAASRR